MTAEELLERMVKPLVWEDDHGEWWAESYEIYERNGIFRAVWHGFGEDGIIVVDDPVLATAKAAAEADNRARIAAALDPAMLAKIAAMMEDEG